MKNYKQIIVVLLLICLTTFSCARLEVGLVDGGVSPSIGLDLNLNPLDINDGGNYSINVNSSANWNTISLGPLNDANSTQHESNGGTLNIKESWLTTFGNGLWCALNGCTMEGDIDMGNNNIENVNNLTFTDWTIKESAGHPDLGGVNVMDLFVTRNGGAELPHMYFQPGAPTHFSGIVRSVGIINENESFLNNTNKTNCQAYFDFVNETLQIDCNTSSTGADLFVGDDFQAIGDVWVKDENLEWHHLAQDITHLDSLLDAMILDPVDVIVVNNGTDSVLVLSQPERKEIQIIFDKVIYSFGTNSTNITLNKGTNSSPATNHVVAELSGDTPILVSYSIHPIHPFGTIDDHSDIATINIGDNGAVIDFVYNTYQGSEYLHNAMHRFKYGGNIYVSGFDAEVDSTEFNHSIGTFINVLTEIRCQNLTMVDDGFFYVNSTGDFTYGTDLSVIDEYSDGTTFGNKYMPLVAGVRVINTSTCGLVFVPAGYPGAGKEYITCLRAEEDAVSVRNIFPSDETVKQAYLPTTWMLLDGGNNQFCAFNNGEYFRKIAGDVTGGGGAPTSPSSDHAGLINLQPWSSTGHGDTFDIDMNFSDNNATNINYLQSTIFNNTENATIGDWLFGNKFNFSEGNNSWDGTTQTTNGNLDVSGPGGTWTGLYVDYDAQVGLIPWVGVGTKTPRKLFELNNGFGAAGFLVAANGFDNNFTGTDDWILSMGQENPNFGGATFGAYSSGQVTPLLFNTYSGTNGSTSSLRIKAFKSNGAGGISAVNSTDTITIFQAGESEKVSISGHGDIWTEGGINVTDNATIGDWLKHLDDKGAIYGNDEDIAVFYNSSSDNIQMDFTNVGVTSGVYYDWTIGDKILNAFGEEQSFYGNGVAGLTKVYVRYRGTKASPSAVFANSGIVWNDMYANVPTVTVPTLGLMTRWGASMTDITIGASKAKIFFASNSIDYLQLTAGSISDNEFFFNFDTSTNDGKYSWSSDNDSFLYYNDMGMRDNKKITHGNNQEVQKYFDGTDYVINMTNNGALKIINGTGLGKVRALEYATSTPKDLSYNPATKRYLDNIPSPESILDIDGKIKRGIFEKAHTTWLEKDLDNCSEVYQYTEWCYILNDKINNHINCFKNKLPEEEKVEMNFTFIEARDISKKECGQREVNVTLIDTQAFENTIMIAELKAELNSLKAELNSLKADRCTKDFVSFIDCFIGGEF